jgi:DNA mismatch repair protein MSH3
MFKQIDLTHFFSGVSSPRRPSKRKTRSPNPASPPTPKSASTAHTTTPPSPLIPVKFPSSFPLDPALHQKSLDTFNPPTFASIPFLSTCPSNSHQQPSKTSPISSKASKKPKFTPLENQFFYFRRKFPNVLFFVESGYKFEFFDTHAQIAAKVSFLSAFLPPPPKELDIACTHRSNFFRASIPVERLRVHLRTLVERGYKIGVIEQIESVALRAKPSAPLARDLTRFYTRATLLGPHVGEISFHDEPTTPEEEKKRKRRPPWLPLRRPHVPTANQAPPSIPNRFMIVYFEEPIGQTLKDAHKIHASMLAVDVASGVVVWDDFTDDLLRNELDSRLALLEPTEIVVPDTLSDLTEHALATYSGDTEPEPADGMPIPRRIRVEKRARKTAFHESESVRSVSEFFAGTAVGLEANGMAAASSASSSNEPLPAPTRGHALLYEALQLPSGVLRCLAVLIQHLASYHLESVLKQIVGFDSFKSVSAMNLDAKTIFNLEIFSVQNAAGSQKSSGQRGSLWWLLNRTTTPMGKRMLRDWISHPLVDKNAIEGRLDAIGDILKEENWVEPVGKVLKSIPVSLCPFFLLSLSLSLILLSQGS